MSDTTSETDKVSSPLPPTPTREPEGEEAQSQATHHEENYDAYPEELEVPNNNYFT